MAEVTTHRREAILAHLSGRNSMFTIDCHACAASFGMKSG